MARLAQLEDSTVAASAMEAQLRSDLAASNEKLATASSDLQQARAEIANLKGDVKVLTETNDFLKQSLDAIKKQTAPQVSPVDPAEPVKSPIQAVATNPSAGTDVAALKAALAESRRAEENLRLELAKVSGPVLSLRTKLQTSVDEAAQFQSLLLEERDRVSRRDATIRSVSP